MDRKAPVALALLALFLSAFFLAVGLWCGMRVVSEPCMTAEECEALSRCEPRIHPLGVPLVLLSLVGVFGAWFERRLPTLGAGVGASALGAIFFMSAAFVGVAVGLILLGSGWLTRPRAGFERRDRVLAIAAALPLALDFTFLALAFTVPRLGTPVVLGLTAGGAFAWFAVAIGWIVRDRRRP